MTIERFTFYSSTIKEINWITKHLKRLPKETLKSLESLESAKEIGIDSPVSEKNLIRIYPLDGEIREIEYPNGNSNHPNGTIFKHRGIEYLVFEQPPWWLKNS